MLCFAIEKRSFEPFCVWILLSKQAAKKVGKWLKDNCKGSVGQGGVSMTCGKGRKRDLDGESRATLDRACQLIEGDHYVLEEGISSELVADIFEEVDGINDPGKQCRSAYVSRPRVVICQINVSPFLLTSLYLPSY